MPLEKNLKPGERWVFDEEVAENFGEMLTKSIPEYDSMRMVVGAIAANFITRRSVVLDLGCSVGENIEVARGFVGEIDTDVEWVGVDNSPEMVAIATKRFDRDTNVAICDGDVARQWGWHRGYSYPLSLVMCVLTLGFIPIEHRQKLLRRIWADTPALIVVEKVLGRDETLNDLLTREYHSVKRSNGYSQEEINRKARALEGVLVPVTADWLEEMLRSAGFKRVECIWRTLNFGAWVAIKD